MKSITLLFPHQLFENNPAVHPGRPVFLVEEFLYFRQYYFHQQKIQFHRASMKFYEAYLRNHQLSVTYIEAHDKRADVRKLFPFLKQTGVETIHYIDPTDDWLHQRIGRSAESQRIALIQYESPLFLNSNDELAAYFSDRKQLRQTDFYIHQRKKRGIWLTDSGSPQGGKWTYDVFNRKKYPQDKTPPQVNFPIPNTFDREAKSYVRSNFSGNYGALSDFIKYPTTFAESRDWLDQFVTNRFRDFGLYEDAIRQDHFLLHHSLLSPLLNVGLLTPSAVLEKTLSYFDRHEIPLNSGEGFIRQIIGWREFLRGIYHYHGVFERTHNFFNFSRTLPTVFYTGSTGLPPVDSVIHQVLKTGYCHHIERLIILGNIMLLLEINPDTVYQWFMELFIDAYDWVMVPNIYGMSQFADGGLLATKPYISGSNYILKMSNFSRGPWQSAWDGLFWHFIHRHRDFFRQNPRSGMMVRTLDKMPTDKKASHFTNAQKITAQLGLSFQPVFDKL